MYKVKYVVVNFKFLICIYIMFVKGTGYEFERLCCLCFAILKQKRDLKYGHHKQRL